MVDGGRQLRRGRSRRPRNQGRRRRRSASGSVDEAEVALDVRLALVLAVERLAADAARETPHSRVDRAMTQQRTLRREALAALVTDERAVRGQRVREIARQVARQLSAVATGELSISGGRRRAHVLGDLLGAQRVLGGAATSLAALHVQRVHHEISLDAVAALETQRRRVVVHDDVLYLRPSRPVRTDNETETSNVAETNDTP